MTHFRVRQLQWKEVPGGLVAQTIFGPIAIKINGDDVKYETWFFDKCKEYEATTVAHAKQEARTKLLEALRPALEIVYDGQESTEVLRGPGSDIDGQPRTWTRGEDQEVCPDVGVELLGRQKREQDMEASVNRQAVLKGLRRLLKSNPAAIDTDIVREEIQKHTILPEELADDPNSGTDTSSQP